MRLFNWDGERESGDDDDDDDVRTGTHSWPMTVFSYIFDASQQVFRVLTERERVPAEREHEHSGLASGGRKGSCGAKRSRGEETTT